jgi:D-lactate dehydrogenase (cytochrome)
MTTQALFDQLRRIVGPDHVIDDEAERAYFSQDISGPGAAVAGTVVAPASVPDLQAVVRAASGAGWAIVPRGGGMSYTRGYTPVRERSVLIDLRRLDRVVEVNTADRYVRVETGCTWGRLYDALEGTGFRTPSFGPLSGYVSTIGGALSQGATFFGSAAHGGAARSVLGLAVVTADGALLHTGGAGAERALPDSYGPDLTALFLGDCGAFGIKAETVLRLIRAPGSVVYASFAFEDRDPFVQAHVDLAGAPGLSECFGFDPQAHANLHNSGFGALESMALARDVAGAEAGLAAKARAVLGLAAEGKRFVKDLRYSLHLCVEGMDADEATGRLAACAETARAAGGTAIPDNIPRVTRSRPFRPIRALLGPAGERWLPTHGLVRLSDAQRVAAQVDEALSAHTEEMARHGITSSRLTVVSGDTFLVEVHFFWPDRLTPFHLRHVTEQQRARHGGAADNPAARKLVHALRHEVVEVLGRLGAWHLQIGRYYPFAETLEAPQRAALHALKQALDPQDLMNPGALLTAPDDPDRAEGGGAP